MSASASLTDMVVAATGPHAHPRLAAILPSLVRHLHAFARETGVSMAEWTAGVEFINECVWASDNSESEILLLCDILGIESLLDSLATAPTGRNFFQYAPTPSCILGPFYRPGAPLVASGGSIVRRALLETEESDTCLLRGLIRSANTGMPIAGTTAILDVWQAAPNGLYDHEDPDQPEMNLRGRVTTTTNSGRFSFYALRPAAYAVSTNGPTGRLLDLLDRTPFRPAHVHFIVSAPGYRPLVTQLFDARGNTAVDSVFAVKDPLVAKFQPLRGDPQARWVADYDFYLVEEQAGYAGVTVWEK